MFVVSDEMALGAMQSIRQHGLRVPDDVSLVGFDDHDVADAVGLTTVRQRVPAIGARAAALLLDELAGGARQTEPEEMPTELVVRSSTRRLT